MTVGVPNTPSRPHQQVSGPLMSLRASTASGAGTSFSLPGAKSSFTVYARRASTDATHVSTKATVILQGSIDGTNWTRLGSSNIAANSTAGTFYKSTSSLAVNYVRLNITAFTTRAVSGADVATVYGYIAVED